VPPRPKSAQHYLQLRMLFDKLRKKAGVPHAKFVGNSGPYGTIAEEGGYTPQAMADQQHNTVHWQYTPPDGSSPGRTPSEGERYAFQRHTIAHELGHLAEVKRIRDAQQAQQYIQTLHQATGASPALLHNEQWPPHQAVAQGMLNSAASARHSQLQNYGYPGETVHSQPNESYADYTANALLPNNRFSRQNRPQGHLIEKLQRQGFLPQGPKPKKNKRR
jgi:hypothetical protein